ncbi:MAG: hypothetical protein CMI53_03690 [Parcubacteria group bacterium]|nr:hypothetical protein [Parcubacteria group bacterium]|tara:strand:+ start:6189 stop:6521 length:333 start_codon:yes stop_codon:yes gene_type:complete
MKKIHWLKKIDKSNYDTSSAKTNHQWNRDPVGYFLIKIDDKDKLIRIGFCTNDNILNHEIVGKNAEDIYYEVLSRNLVSLMEHAAYIGKELTRAEVALKNGTEYVQDLDQ